jgi:hypothetical protein
LRRNCSHDGFGHLILQLKNIVKRAFQARRSPRP